jgi:hypothetical protein
LLGRSRVAPVTITLLPNAFWTEICNSGFVVADAIVRRADAARVASAPVASVTPMHVLEASENGAIAIVPETPPAAGSAGSWACALGKMHPVATAAGSTLCGEGGVLVEAQAARPVAKLARATKPTR